MSFAKSSVGGSVGSSVTDRVRTSIKGRGALTNEASRYLPTRTLYDDGEAAGAKTEGDHGVDKRCSFYPDVTRRLITTNKSPDISFDQSINAYKGCEHGCVYCFARPTHAYLDLSPGLDFETQIFYKTNVEECLRAELERKSYQPAVIALGTNTDPYQPVEKRIGSTRLILETLLEYRHPVSIVTKGALLERDIDLLAKFAAQGLVSVMLSITTFDNGLKAKLEPRAASAAKRLDLVRSLAEVGVPVGVMLAPLIPLINDMELEDILERSAAAGATRANYILLRLPAEVQGLFADWLHCHYPERAEHVLNLIRDTRGGELYQAKWGERMRGVGPVAEVLAQRFDIAARKYGLSQSRDSSVGLRTDLFRVPSPQGSLF